MIGVTRLLCNSHSPGDVLRYGSPHQRPVVVWNITQRCNLQCLHCYAEAGGGEFSKEFTTTEAETIIDSLAEFGVPVLMFSGGEPLLRADLAQLVSYAAARGIRVVISTNGTLFTPGIAAEMKQAGVSYVGISLDGLESTNDRFRGKGGAFRQALAGIRHCRDAGIRVGLRLTLTKRNYQELPGIFQLLVDENIPRCCFYHLVYAGRGSSLIGEDLNHQETREAVEFIFSQTLALHFRGIEKDILTVDNHTDGVYLYLRVKQGQPERAEKVYQLLLRNGGNSAGVGIAAIDHLGNVHPDQFWRHYSFGNVRERKFGDIWEDLSDPLMERLKVKKTMVKGRCSRCCYLDLCGGNSRVRAEAVYGDVWAEDPACYLTKQELGIL